MENGRHLHQGHPSEEVALPGPDVIVTMGEGENVAAPVGHLLKDGMPIMTVKGTIIGIKVVIMKIEGTISHEGAEVAVTLIAHVKTS